MARKDKTDRKGVHAHLPKRIKTVNDLLTRSDIATVVSDLVEHQSELKDVITIFVDSKGLLYFDLSANSTYKDLIYMIERTKHLLMLEVDDVSNEG